MRHALKATWQEEPAEAAPEPGRTANVLRFDASPRRVAETDEQSDVTELMSALGRAAEEIRCAESRSASLAADYGRSLSAADARAREAEDRVAILEQRLKVAETSLRLSERKFMQISDWHARQAAETEAELERSTAEQHAAMRDIIEDAGNRIYAAEARAMETSREFATLCDYIRSNFGI